MKKQTTSKKPRQMNSQSSESETKDDQLINMYQPHDSFFKRYFRHPEVFISLVQSVVNADLVELLDFSTLVFESDTYVDKQFRNHFSDLVATVLLKSESEVESKTDAESLPETSMDSTSHKQRVIQIPNKKTISIYLLAEHKSYDDAKALLQISRYQHQLWEKDAKNNPSGYLTPVVSILFHHGKSTSVPASFKELFDPKLPLELQAYVPQYQIALMNLTALGIDEFPKNPSLAMAYWSMKYGRTHFKRVVTQVAEIWQGWNKLKDIDQYLDEVMAYLTAMNDLTMEEFVSIMDNILQDQLIREEFMFRPNTMLARHAKEHYEKGIEQGKKLGIEQGIETAYELLKKNLKAKGFSDQEIRELFEDADGN